MDCEQCGKKIKIKDTCWYDFGGGDIICDDCHNRNLSETCENDKDFKDKAVMEDVERQITQVQIMAEYAMHIFEFATRNRYAKEEVDDFFKEPNAKNMFYLLQDLFLPMAAGMVVEDSKYGEALREFPNVRKNIKRLIEDIKNSKEKEE